MAEPMMAETRGGARDGGCDRAGGGARDGTPPARAAATGGFVAGLVDGTDTARELPEEVPIALVYDGSTLAVMMATPEDLVDFATGFTLSEGLARVPSAVDVVRHRNGIECRLTLDEAGRRAFERRRRATTGRSSCGLCGVRSLAQAVPAPPSVGGRALRLSARDVRGAVASLRDHQPLHDRTRAAHAAGFFVPGRGLLLVREDVGRHNALDKLAGAVVRAGLDPAGGAVVLTSRVSIEMVQKAAMLGAAAILAVSAPTALAVRTARAAGQTLVGNVRGERFEPFAHPERIVPDAPDPGCPHERRPDARPAGHDTAPSPLHEPDRRLPA